MYDEHVPLINKAMRASPIVFNRGVMFAFLSARVKFNLIPAYLADVIQNGEDSKALWGHKLDAYRYITNVGNASLLWSRVCTVPLCEVAEAIDRLCVVPGLGIIKAAFVAQMLGHDTACLDVRNSQREGLYIRSYTGYHKEKLSFHKAIVRYVHDTKGRAQELWDAWCNEVGPDYGMTGEQCSDLHYKTIVPTAWEGM